MINEDFYAERKKNPHKDTIRESHHPGIVNTIPGNTTGQLAHDQEKTPQQPTTTIILETTPVDQSTFLVVTMIVCKMVFLEQITRLVKP